MTTQTASTSENVSAIQMEKRIADLESELAIARRVIGAERYLHEFFQRYGYNEKDVTEKLHGCSETNNVWLAVQLALEQMITIEDHHARTPGLSSDDLRWNVARTASLRDLKHSLYMLWAKANKPVKAS